MKRANNNMGKAVMVLFGFILAFSVVSAFGVSYPQPQNIELKPGQSSYFTFQIQTDDFPVTCVPVVESMGELELAFNQQYEVEANMRYNVKPQVIVPKQTGLGNYETSFCVECSPSEDVEGSRIIPRVCNLPITVNVVAERTRQNLLEETTAAAVWVLILVFLSVSILILAAVVFYLVARRKRAAGM